MKINPQSEEHIYAPPSPLKPLQWISAPRPGVSDDEGSGARARPAGGRGAPTGATRLPKTTQSQRQNEENRQNTVEPETSKGAKKGKGKGRRKRGGKGKGQGKGKPKGQAAGQIRFIPPGKGGAAGLKAKKKGKG